MESFRLGKVMADPAVREVLMLGVDPSEAATEVGRRAADREPVAGFTLGAPARALELAKSDECRVVDSQLVPVILGQQAAVEAGSRSKDGVTAGVPPCAFDWA